MASVVIWRDDATGVVAEWNKGESPSVSSPDRFGLPTKYYGSQPKAILAAKRRAKQLQQEVRDAEIVET